VPRGLVGVGIGLDVASCIKFDAQRFDHALVHRVDEAHREQHEVGIELELGTAIGLILSSTCTQCSFATLPFAPENFCVRTENFALYALLVARRCAQLEGPIRPTQKLVLFQRRLRQKLEIGD